MNMPLSEVITLTMTRAEVFAMEDCVKLVRAIYALRETDAGRAMPQDIRDEVERIVIYADAHGVCS